MSEQVYTAEDASRLIAHLHRGGQFNYWWRSEGRRSKWYQGNVFVLPTAPDTYFNVHPIAARPDRGDLRYIRGRIDELAAVNCLFAEFDGKDFGGSKQAILDHVEGLPLRPSAIVDSGHGYHCYWLLDQTLYLDQGDNRERAMLRQEQWVRLTEGDPGAADLARVLRVPGTTNAKREPIMPVELVQFTDDRYSLAEFDAFLSKLTIPATEAPGINGRYHEGQRNAALTSQAGKLRRAGMSESEILGALQVCNRERCDPPLPESEVETIAGSVARYAPEEGHVGADADNAERFVSEHGQDIKWCEKLATWLFWDGRYWQRNGSLAVERLAEQTARNILAAAVNLPAKEAKAVADIGTSLLSQGRMLAMIGASKRKAEVDVEELNNDRGYLTCANGVVDLRRGELLPFERGRYSTRMTPIIFQEDARCPMWESFLTWIMADNVDMVAWLQRAVGYTLTGFGDAKMFAFLTGGGDNGKTTFLETLRMLCGKYSQRVSIECLLTSGNKRYGEQKNTPYTSIIEGARFVCADEMPPGANLNTSVIKDWTGGDMLTAMQKYELPHQFQQSMFLWMYGNHQPKVGDETDAMWGRLRLVRFPVTIPEDRRRPMAEVLAEFRSELTGILAWAVQGAYLAIEDGVGTTDDIKRDTAEYRQAQDIVGLWLRENCLLHPDASIPKDQAYRDFSAWCHDNMLGLLGKIALTNRLKKDHALTVGGHANSSYLGFKLAKGGGAE